MNRADEILAQKRAEDRVAEAAAKVLSHDQRLWVRRELEEYRRQVASMQRQIGNSSPERNSSDFLVGVYSKQVGRLSHMAEVLRLDDLYRERARLEKLNDWTDVAR